MPSLQQMHEFASRDFAMEKAIATSKAVDEAVAKGEYPVRAGCFMVMGPDEIRLCRDARYPHNEQTTILDRKESS